MSSLLAKYLTTAALTLHAMFGCCLHHAHGAAKQHSTIQHADCCHHGEQGHDQDHDGDDCDKAHCLVAMKCSSRTGWNLDQRLRDAMPAVTTIVAQRSAVSHFTDLLGESRFSDGSSTRLHLIQECFLL